MQNLQRDSTNSLKITMTLIFLFYGLPRQAYGLSRNDGQGQGAILRKNHSLSQWRYEVIMALGRLFLFFFWIATPSLWLVSQWRYWSIFTLLRWIATPSLWLVSQWRERGRFYARFYAKIIASRNDENRTPFLRIPQNPATLISWIATKILADFLAMTAIRQD